MSSLGMDRKRRAREWMLSRSDVVGDPASRRWGKGTMLWLTTLEQILAAPRIKQKFIKPRYETK